MITHRRLLSAFSVFWASLLISSCTNLTAVREWSQTSLEATQYNQILTTYSNTPQRLKRYDPSGPWDSQIDIRKKQAEVLRQVLAVISDYMASIATLSSDSTIDYNKNVDGLTKSISKLNTGISKNTLGAAGTLMKTLTGAAAKGYQAKQLTNIIEKANDPLQEILKGELRHIIDRDFRRDLEIEKTLLDRYYDSLLQQDPVPSEAAKTALLEWKEFRLDQNTRRLKAIDAYLTILDNLAEGHQKLYDNRHELDRKILIRDLFSLVVEIHKQIKIIAES